MSDAPLNNARRSSRFPIVGNGDGELELPGGMRVPVRIENESAGGFGVYCNADVSVWQNEEVVLLRSGDAFEVRVAHVAEVEVPRRSGEPEPEWLPLRLGLERRRLLAARPADKPRRSWLGRLLVHFDRPDHPSMILTGVLMAVAFVAAPLLWVTAMQSHRQPLLSAAKNAGETVLNSIGSWFGTAKRGAEETTPSASPWRESAQEAQRRANTAKKELQALVAPLQRTGNAALEKARQWLEASARSAAQRAAAVQDTAAGNAERLVDAGGDAFEKLLQQWESGEFLDPWDATLDQWDDAIEPWGAALEEWNATTEQAKTDFGGLPSIAPPTEWSGFDGAEDDSPTTTSSTVSPDGAAASPDPTPPPPSKQPPATTPPKPAR